MKTVPENLARLTGDRRQFASVRRIVLDEGVERGVAALVFSTGGGLDFWVLCDRAMDIGSLSWRGTAVGWQSPSGFRHPALVDPESDNGRGFERGFSGFLMTCGLDHTRQPSSGQPLHGHLPFLPARMKGWGEDWDAAEPVLFAEGEIVQWRHGAEHLALVRRIEAPIGGNSLRIRDRVENRGFAPQRHALLYHMNIGYPFLRPEARLELMGKAFDLPIVGPREAMLPVIGCEKVGSSTGQVNVKSGSLQLDLSFDAETLPFFQHWYDPRPGGFVLALEPCTSDRPMPGAIAAEPLLDLGEQRDYQLDVSVRESVPMS